MSRRSRLPFFTIRALMAATLAAALTAPFFASGCSAGTACIRWPAKNGASCPNRDDALSIMQSGCGPVTAVHSDGERDGDVCCYDVTQSGEFDEFACPPPFPGPSTGITVTSGPISTVSATGPAPACSGTLFGDCGVCVEASCCSQILDCLEKPNCMPCLNDPAACPIDDPEAGILADDLDLCARALCPDPCFGGVNENVPECGVSPSGNGACVTIDEGQGIACNPITNEGCFNTTACDVTPKGGLGCEDRPFWGNVCDPCGATGWCGAGATCVNGFCALACCDDTECGPGYCDTKILTGSPMPFGVCMHSSGGTGGAGGAGGQSGTGGAGGAGGQGGG
jgi:hypothetical protein